MEPRIPETLPPLVRDQAITRTVSEFNQRANIIYITYRKEQGNALLLERVIDGFPLYAGLTDEVAVVHWGMSDLQTKTTKFGKGTPLMRIILFISDMSMHMLPVL